MMRIPIFVSCPTELSPDQERSRKVIMQVLEDLQLEPRALGRSDYPKDYPLKEVRVIAQHCSGAIILGFEQFFSKSGIRKRGSKKEEKIPSAEPVRFPTPWNNLEAGILFGLKLPILIFKETGVEGGVFDVGTSEVFVHTMPPPKPTAKKLAELKQVMLKWEAEVSRRYYNL